MGGSASVVPKLGALPGGVFLDEKLIHGERMLKLNPSLRTNFVKYIKDGRWTEILKNVDNSSSLSLSQSSLSTWTKFGYKSPHCSGGSKSNEERSGKPIETERSIHRPSNNTSTDLYLLLQRSELRPVLIAVLLPLFFQSSGGIDTSENSITEDWKNEDNTTHIYKQVKVTPSQKFNANATKTGGRLQEWLLKAAALFKANELHDYLANPSGSFTKDFLQSLQSIPVRITIGAVDAAKQESKIIYTNTTPATKSQYNNLHEMFSADCSPGGASQVCKAIFDAKRYKRCVASADGTCTLRAMKPVYDKAGQYVYALALESSPFEDPVLQLQDENNAVSERTFQQIEDLLQLLPLLIRNYK